MNLRIRRISLGAALLAALTGLPGQALACAACYGASDSPLAQGMNWGIMTLLGVIGCVLATLVAFFVHVGRRSARLNQAEQSSPENGQQP